MLSLAALAVFTVWSALVFDTAFVPQMDQRIAHTFFEWNQQHDHLDGVMIALTFCANPEFFAVLSLALACLWLVGRRDKKFAVGWIVLLIGCGIINWAVKEIVDRDRPPRAIRHPYVRENNESYPSGHAMGSTVAYGMLGIALARCLHRRRFKAFVLTFTTLFVAAISFSRVYLRAHWFSDVVGGCLLGLAYLWCFLALIRSRGWLRLWPWRRTATMPH